MGSFFEEFTKWDKIIESEINNQSDRSTALVCCSMLDSQLQKLLKTFFIDNKKIEKEMFSSNMPLSTFCSKINLAYYLGLISEDEQNNLNILRKIRNILAHQIEVNGFDATQAIVDLTSNLYIPSKMYFPQTMILTNSSAIIDLDPFKDDCTPRNKFIQNFKYLSMYLYIRIYTVSDNRRKEYKADTAVNLYRKVIDDYKKALESNRQLKKESFKLQKEIIRRKIVELKKKGQDANEEEGLLAKIENELNNFNNSKQSAISQKFGVSEEAFFKNMSTLLDAWDEMQES